MSEVQRSKSGLPGQVQKPKVLKTKSPKDARSTSRLFDLRPGREDCGNVPKFDTCEDVRKDVNDHLRNVLDAYQVSLVRGISPMLPPDTRTSFDGPQLGKSVKMKGPRDGANTSALDAPYVYSVILRIREGKSKTEERPEMGEAWGMEGGMEREGSHNMWITLPRGEKPKVYRLSRLQIVKGSFLNGWL